MAGFSAQATASRGVWYRLNQAAARMRPLLSTHAEYAAVVTSYVKQNRLIDRGSRCRTESSTPRR